jgi:hypothetical protein
LSIGEAKDEFERPKATLDNAAELLRLGRLHSALRLYGTIVQESPAGSVQQLKVSIEVDVHLKSISYRRYAIALSF